MVGSRTRCSASWEGEVDRKRLFSFIIRVEARYPAYGVRPSQKTNLPREGSDALQTEQKRWISTKTIRERLEISRTASYEIAKEIARRSDEPDAVVKRGRMLRVRDDLVERWIVENGYKPDDPVT